MSAAHGGTVEVYHETAARRSINSSNTYCPRCESVGHDEWRCPFPDDAATRVLAAKRRERRARPERPRPVFEKSAESLPPTGMSDAGMAALLERLSGGKWLRRHFSRRGRLMRALAYCRLRLQRARARRSSYSENWVAFYRDECARLRRCIDAGAREAGKVVFPEMRAEVKNWLVLDEWRQTAW